MNSNTSRSKCYETLSRGKKILNLLNIQAPTRASITQKPQEKKIIVLQNEIIYSSLQDIPVIPQEDSAMYEILPPSSVIIEDNAMLDDINVLQCIPSSCNVLENISNEKELSDTEHDKSDEDDYVVSKEDINSSSSSTSSDEEKPDEEYTNKTLEIEDSRLRHAKKITKKRKMKTLKDSGQEYINTRGSLVNEKKILENPCAKRKCVNKCNSFSEEERQELFAYYWKLGDSNKQKSFLADCVAVKEVKRRRRSAGIVNRKISNEYYYLLKQNVRLKVCQQFLLNTLAITQRLIRTVIENKNLSKFPQQDLRGIQNPPNKTTTDQLAFLDNFINSLPLVPSHYCRSSSTKMYLPAEVKSVSNLYRKYLDSHSKSGDRSAALKKCMFLRLFKTKYNIAIHVPRKDKCIKCERYKNLGDSASPTDTEIYEIHIKEKDYCKKMFLKEQELSSENGTLVASLDLQKVLATPHGDTMTLGFSRKYAVYNFTVYETKSRRGFCYIWGEKDGKRGSNEIATNLLTYLEQLDSEQKFKKVSLFCDNCAGQNKNKAIFATIRHFLDNSNFLEDISLNFLITGHTYMPVDSMHAVIEKYIRKTIVEAPSEWPTILRNARKNPFPYVVKEMTYKDFKDFKSINLVAPIKIKISEVKTAAFNKFSTEVKYTTSYSDDEIEKTFSLKIKNGSIPVQCYKGELPINKLKYNNLKGLCESLAIDPKYHFEYLTLKTSGNIPDVLNESDIDDQEV